MQAYQRYLPILLLLLAATPAWATSHTVMVGPNNQLVFQPSTLTINQGDTVTFTNAGGLHNVHADDNSFECSDSCNTGSNTPSTNNWSDTVTFNTVGTVSYHCDQHASLGMVGSITVQAAQSGFSIGPGITGNWFNPNQSGHGFAIEVLNTTPPQMIASWFVFTPMGASNSGQQAWVGGLGPINGNTVTLQAFQAGGAGALFPPNFNASQVQTTPWGTMTFTFTDCNTGHVHWAATVPGYGSGDLDLVRLTMPAGLTCP